MDLTPIKIRYKKRKAGTSKPTKRSIPATKAPLPESYSSTPPAKRLKTASSKNSKPSIISAMPSLQGLPQELLEIIFLESMNISLPRASHDLGRKLSSSAIIMTYTMRTFFDTVNHHAPIRVQQQSPPVDPSAQTELLTCQFFTWPFFLAYVQRAHDEYVRMRGKFWARTGVAIPGVEQFEGVWPFKFTKITYFSFAEGFRIPEKLLRGPWTKDKANLLYVLVSLSGEIDWHGSLAGETAKEGLKEAVEEGEERAVAALSVLVGIQKEIGTEMLRYAVMECGCDFKIVRHLLFNAQILASKTRREDLDFYDAKIWAWADEEGNEGKRKQLKRMLKKADTFSLEFYLPDEQDWSGMVRIVPFPYSGPKFDARSEYDVVSREMLTRLYQSHGRRITRTRNYRIDPATQEISRVGNDDD